MAIITSLPLSSAQKNKHTYINSGTNIWKNDIYKCRVTDGGVRGNFAHDLPTEIFAYTQNVFCPTATSQPLLIRQTQRHKHFPYSYQENVHHKLECTATTAV